MNQYELFSKLSKITTGSGEYTCLVNMAKDTIFISVDCELDIIGHCELNLQDNCGKYSIEWQASFADFCSEFLGEIGDGDDPYDYDDVAIFEEKFENFNARYSNMQSDSIKQTLINFNAKIDRYMNFRNSKYFVEPIKILIRELNESPYEYLNYSFEDMINYVLTIPNFDLDIKESFGVSDIDDETIKNKLKGLLSVDFTDLSDSQRKNIKYLTLAQKLYEKDNC